MFLQITRIAPSIQPNMMAGVYLKSWDGQTIGFPPADGGGGPGLVTNLTARNVFLDNVSLPIQLYQNSHSLQGNAPSLLQFANLTFANWTGTTSGSTVVDIACSPAAPCPGIVFENIDVAQLNGGEPTYKCSNVISEKGLSGCNATTQL